MWRSKERRFREMKWDDVYVGNGKKIGKGNGGGVYMVEEGGSEVVER